MSERGEVAGVEDAYLHFDDVFKSGIDVMVGQFQTSDPLMKRELRLTYEDYLIYKTKIGDSATNLTYDRGIMVTYGIAATGTDLVGMVVNGNGKDPADAGGNFDKDSDKNFGFRLLQGIGEHVSVGGFYYYGKEGFGAGGAAASNEITYYGPDVVIGAGPATLTVQYLHRRDTAPGYALVSDEDIKTDGIVAELVLAPQGDMGRHWITLLYNWVESDVQEKLDLGGADPGPFVRDDETYTLSHSYLIRRNVRSVLEYTYNNQQEASRFTVGVVSAF
jgi:hypothetical protein